MNNKAKFNWKFLLVTAFTLIIAIILILYLSIIRQTMYLESSEHLDEISRQMAVSIEKQSENQWNMVNIIYRYFSANADQEWSSISDYTKEKRKTGDLILSVLWMKTPPITIKIIRSPFFLTKRSPRISSRITNP